MKTIIKIVATLCLVYAILMLLIDTTYSLLSLSQQTNISSLIVDKFIPYVVSIVSMIYCITHICQHGASNGDSHNLHNRVDDWIDKTKK